MKKQLLIILFLVVPLEGLSLLNQELFRSTSRKDLDGMQAALNQGASVTCRDDEGYTALHRAVIAGNKDGAALLISRNRALLNERVESTHKDTGKTALQLADAYGHAEIATYLLEQGAEDLDAQRDLIVGCETGDINAVHYVLTHRRPVINKATLQGITPLHIAVTHKHTELVQLLLEHKADVSGPDFAQRTSLHLAVFNGDYQTARKLLQAGAQSDALTLGGITPLMSAVLNEQIECVIVLLHYGAQTQIATPYGTALNFAYYIGNQDIIQHLLNRGATASNSCAQIRSIGLTSSDLSEAIKKNDRTKVALMIELGVDIITPTGTPATAPLITAIIAKRNECALMLITEGADIQWRDEQKATPLHYAARTRNPLLIELLVAVGADIHAQDAQGNSPLHYAAEGSSETHGAPETVMCLIRLGADRTKANLAGKTPYEIAKEAKNSLAPLLNPDAPLTQAPMESAVSAAPSEAAALVSTVSQEEAQRNRWQQDRTLLQEHIEKNPQDTRALLYLGLTEKWLGNDANAYATLKKRVSMPNLPEEDYYALYSLAEVTELLSQKDPQNYRWEEAQGYYIQAYALRPYRAEPLIRLADYYLTAQQYDLSYLYARRATELPIPSQAGELLPVEPEEYTHLRWQILSTAAHHIGEFEVAHSAAQKGAMSLPVAQCLPIQPQLT